MSGLLCRARAQGHDDSQLFVDDATGHSMLITKTGSVIDLAQNPTYVILDLGCAKSMDSRYAVTMCIKADHVRGLDYELIPLTSNSSCAKSETTIGTENLLPD